MFKIFLIILFIFVVPFTANATVSYSLSPQLKSRYFDSNGEPLAGGLLYSYVAGTTTPLATYTDESGNTPNTNPVVLDSTGSANVWMGPGAYKFVLEDASGNVEWTIDSVVQPGAPVTISLTSQVTGVLPIANGGTNSNAQITNGLNYYDGTKVTSDADLTWDGDSLDIVGSYSVSSTTSASIPLPRMSNTQMNAITPLSGGMGVYNENSNAPYWYLGAGWHQVSFLDTVETLTNKSISGSSNTLTNIPMGSATGVLPIANGGTNNGSLAVTAGGVLYTDGSKIVNAGAGTTGQVYTSNGSSAPSWKPAGGSGSGINILQTYNWNAELGATTNWSNSGGTFAVDSTASNVANGTYAFTFTASASGQTVTSNLTALPAGLYGHSCLLEFYYKGFDSNMTAEVTDGTNVIVSQALTAQSGYVLQDINFPCPSSGSVQAEFISTGSSAQGWFDEVHLGSADNVSQVSQARFVGGMESAGASSCVYSESTSTSDSNFVDLSTGTSCAAWTVTSDGPGAITAQGTGDHRLVYSNMPPGEYVFELTGAFRQSAAAASTCLYRLSDGTNTYQPQAGEVGTSVSWSMPQLRYHVSITTPGSRTYKLQAADDSASAVCEWNNAANFPASWKVYYFPTQSQLAVRADNSDFGPTAYTPTGSWTSNTTYTGMYSRHGKFMHGDVFLSLSGAPTSASLTVKLPSGFTIDTTALAAGSSGNQFVGKGLGSHSSDYNFQVRYNSTTDVNVVYQNATTGTTAAVNATSPVTWASGDSVSVSFDVPIVGWSANTSAPQLVGSVTSNTSGQERIERASITNNGTASIAAQSGSWISSITRNATGDISLTIAAGMFSAAPQCNVTVSGVGAPFARACALYAEPTTSLIRVSCATFATPSASDNSFDVVCMGPR